MRPESSGDPLIDLLTRALGRLLPVPGIDAVPDEAYALLRRRFRAANAAADVLCCAGLLLGILLPRIVGRPGFTGWDLGVAFGLCILLPTAWVALLGLAHGRAWLADYLLAYSLRYGVHWRGLLLYVYLPVIAFGAASAVVAYG